MPGSLERYHEKRDFAATPEPRGRKGRAKARSLRFVVQKHRASHLHYDFRLEAGGVLKSWAVPKGPSLNPADKRLAMHVEDHPLDYRTFEGIIPPGNYGAGEVIVWDEGTYTPLEGGDPAEQIGAGKIKFVLHGKKLRGAFTLVRMKGRAGEHGEPWLLVKDRDDAVDPDWEIDRHDGSVKSGKTLEQIAADPHAARWVSHRNVRAKRDPLPTIEQPMLATLIDEPFDDENWLFEIKWDGYRALCTVYDDGGMTLVSRNGLDLLRKFPELRDLATAFSQLPVLVDGEIVSLDERGRSSFERLQEGGHPVHFAAFDLLYAGGKDLRKEPLEQRKTRLEEAIGGDGPVLYSKHVIGTGVALYDQARRRRLEGIVGKRRASTYQMRRSCDWVKIKAQLRQEFVVGGYTEPRGSRKGFGALLLGVYRGKSLVYVGHVGTGFNAATLAALAKRLDALERKTSPFSGEVEANTPAHWVKPELVVEVRFTEWTREGRLRQPAFLGMRADKDPKSVRREEALDTDDVVS